MHVCRRAFGCARQGMIGRNMAGTCRSWRSSLASQPSGSATAVRGFKSSRCSESDRARPSHICTGTWLAPSKICAGNAPRCHICAGAGLTPTTSSLGLAQPVCTSRRAHQTSSTSTATWVRPPARAINRVHEHERVVIYHSMRGALILFRGVHHPRGVL